LDARARRVTDAMKIAAAEAIAGQAPEGELVPEILDRTVHQAVARAVARAA
jgi:malate dehydrogenase (oxaloacetate-decarboxylating)